jgi:hypothetical protein
MISSKATQERRDVQLNLRVTSSLVAQIDELRAAMRPIPTRSSVIVQLLENALKLPPKKLAEQLIGDDQPTS